MGWPDRSSRADYSPGPVVDEKKVSDPIRQVGAGIANLAFWDAAGLGRTAPKAALLIDPITLKAVSAGFVWDVDALYADTLLSSIPWIQSFVVNGVGDYTLTWVPEVGDIDAVLTTLAFQVAQVKVCWHAGSTPPADVIKRNVRAAVELVAPGTMSIKIVDNAGAGGARDAPFMLLGW